MIRATALKTTGNVVEGNTYYIGGLHQGTSMAVLMGPGDKIVRGVYHVEEVFGITREELLKKIKEGQKHV